MAMSDHGQDARATSELTLEGAVEEGLGVGSADLIGRSAAFS